MTWPFKRKQRLILALNGSTVMETRDREEWQRRMIELKVALVAGFGPDQVADQVVVNDDASAATWNLYAPADKWPTERKDMDLT